jgi:pilus assembly protein CpaE
LVIDNSKGYSELDLLAMRAADSVLMVTQLDLPCLRNIVRLMMSFGQMESIKDKVKVIVNRVGLDSHIGLKKAQETIGRDIYWQIPNDYRTMVEVRNNGVPLMEHAPKAAITQAIVQLAEALNGDREAQQDPKDLSTRARAVEKLLSLWPSRKVGAEK